MPCQFRSPAPKDTLVAKRLAAPIPGCASAAARPSSGGEVTSPLVNGRCLANASVQQLTVGIHQAGLACQTSPRCTTITPAVGSDRQGALDCLRAWRTTNTSSDIGRPAAASRNHRTSEPSHPRHASSQPRIASSAAHATAPGARRRPQALKAVVPLGKRWMSPLIQSIHVS